MRTDQVARPTSSAQAQGPLARGLSGKLDVGAPTVRDILDAWPARPRPARGPAAADLPPRAILKLEDLTPGMELKGTVLNVVDSARSWTSA